MIEMHCKLKALVTLLLLSLHLCLNSGTGLDMEAPAKETAFISYKGHWADSVLKTLTTREKIAQLIGQDISLINSQELAEAPLGAVYASQLIHLEAAAKLQKTSNLPLFVMADDAIAPGPELWEIAHLTCPVEIGRQASLKTRTLLSLGANIITSNWSAIKHKAGNSSRIAQEKAGATGAAYYAGITKTGAISAAGPLPCPALPLYKKTAADSPNLVAHIIHAQQAAGAMLLSGSTWENIAGTEKKEISGTKAWENFLRKQIAYSGLIIAYAPDTLETANTEIALKQLISGANICYGVKNRALLIKMAEEAVENGTFPARELNLRCKRNLMAKEWLMQFRAAQKPTVLASQAAEISLSRKSIVAISGNNAPIPIRDLSTKSFMFLSFGDDQPALAAMLGKYASFSHNNYKAIWETESLPDKIAEYASYRNIVLYIGAEKAGSICGSFREALSLISASSSLYIVLQGSYHEASCLSGLPLAGYMLLPRHGKMQQEHAAQALFGGSPVSGGLPAAWGIEPPGAGISNTGRGRLAYGSPIELGLEEKAFNRIDSIAREAIRQKAMPGCQVLVAKEGIVIYEKSLGHHTYEKHIQVNNSDIYDLASITKIAASTVSLMKLQDEGMFSTRAKLKDYFPYLDATNKGELQMIDILAHRAGLAAWIPFYLTLIEGYDDPGIKISSTRRTKEHTVKAGNNFFLKTGYRYRDSLLSDSATDLFAIKIADGLYLNKWYIDSMQCRIENSAVQEGNKYRYSDLGFIYMHSVIEKLSGSAIEKYTDSVFYAPLGAHTLGYKPLDYFDKSRIVPTELDAIFRKQLVHGYVHDPGAAMNGGLGGHAGLFANANDLAKVMQMLVQKGWYGGRQYIESSTVEKYTKCHFCNEGNRRGLGFDKPTPDPKAASPVCQQVSLQSYGHAGFTGTIAWADPEYELVYIFLSNRVHPDSDNSTINKLGVRSAIQNAIYDAIKAPCRIRAEESLYESVRFPALHR
jgi:beta-N-acetylhexosaminidase